MICMTVQLARWVLPSGRITGAVARPAPSNPIPSIAAQGKLGKHIQSHGGMEPMVWDGQAKSIKFVLKTNPANSAAEPATYELELARLVTCSSYKIETERLGIRTARFDGWAALLKDAPLKFNMHLNGPTQADQIAVISLLDLESLTFYSSHLIASYARCARARG